MANKSKLVEAVVWRESVYRNKFKCMCGTLLFNYETSHTTEAVVKQKLPIDGKNYLYCKNCGRAVAFVEMREDVSKNMTQHYEKQKLIDAETKTTQLEKEVSKYKSLLSAERAKSGNLKAELEDKNAVIHALNEQLRRTEEWNADSREALLYEIRSLNKQIRRMQDSFIEETGHRWEDKE